ncbi:hypothetical protein [Nonomuraea sp. NPDC002799]
MLECDSAATASALRRAAAVAGARQPIAVTAAYDWGPGRRSATTTSEAVAVVVTAPADGRRHLSTIAPVDFANATGQVEADQSNGGPTENDGNLITIGGVAYDNIRAE